MGRTGAQYRESVLAKTTLVAPAILCALSFGSVALGQSAETLIDRIVAVANGEPILHSEIQAKVKQGPLVVVSEFPENEKSSPFARALHDRINFTIISQKAEEMEIEVSITDVENEIKRFLTGRGLTKEGLVDFLAQQGKSYEEYQRDFHDQMLLSRFQGRVIHPLVKITDKDVETYFLKQIGSSSELVRLDLRQILIKVPANAIDEVKTAKRNLAQDVLTKLNNGMPFEEAVKLYSDDPSARTSGGKMSSIKIGDLAPAIRQAVEPLEVGGFSQPVETSMGLHIFSLEGKKFAGGDEFNQRKQQLQFELRNLELTNQTRKWLAETRQRSKIEIKDDTIASTGSEPAGG